VMHQYVCDSCGDSEESEVDELPDGWTHDEEDPAHYCEKCS
jgi:DNA-directed RNA polymerase subunit RPC12/RpoP